MRTIYPPNPFSNSTNTVFLAGSIEMGKAEDWQQMIIDAVSDLDITILNPRRKDWDASWEQKIDNPQFAEQVNWEIDAQEQADLIVMYLDPGTKAPITLLELGLFAASKKLVVCCPDGYWRKGNVDIVCQRYKIPQVGTIEELIEVIRKNFRT